MFAQITTLNMIIIYILKVHHMKLELYVTSLEHSPTPTTIAQTVIFGQLLVYLFKYVWNRLNKGYCSTQ